MDSAPIQKALSLEVNLKDGGCQSCDFVHLTILRSKAATDRLKADGLEAAFPVSWPLS